MASMILKCGKTGRLFFSQAEATKHAEELGAANFEEVAADAKLWVDAETKRRAFWSMDEITRFRQRTRQSEEEFPVIECTVAEYKVNVEQNERKYMNDPQVVKYAKKKLVDALVEVKGHSVIRAEKGCWFTSNKGVPEAEAWIEEHKGEEDIDKPLRLAPGEGQGGAGGDSGAGDAMDVDQEGDGAAGAESQFGTGCDPEATENGAFVTEKVNPEWLIELEAMGFTKIRAEKALYMTHGGDLSHAVNWLGDHGEDSDIDHPLTTDVQKLKADAAEAAKKPKMSKEEAERAAIELQNRLKKEREAREKQEAKDKERARIESTKMMLETNALLEEENRKRAIDQRKREADEHAKHAADLKERLRLDYIERFGHEPPAEKEEEKDEFSKKPAKQQALYWINQLKKEHEKNKETGADQVPALKTCIKTLQVYLKNAKENPDNPKFHVLKKSGKAFSERIAPFAPEAYELLRINGFKDGEDPDQFQIEGQVNGWLMGETIKFLDLISQKF